MTCSSCHLQSRMDFQESALLPNAAASLDCLASSACPRGTGVAMQGDPALQLWDTAVAFSSCCAAGSALSAMLTLPAADRLSASPCWLCLTQGKHMRTTNDLVCRPSTYHGWSCKLLAALHSCFASSCACMCTYGTGAGEHLRTGQLATCSILSNALLSQQY